MSIMLEAFCDLTDYPALASQPEVERVYAPWHALEQQAISGNLLTNIFAGGTVDSEWAFLTGSSAHDAFRGQTDSYVWYLRAQGYQTFGSHPGFGWFYNRQNVNQYLGFEEYWFTENHYKGLVDPIGAMWNSDHILMEQLLAQMQERTQTGQSFTLSVTYQNHGPYESDHNVGQAYLTPAASGLPEEACYVFNNYMRGVEDTLDAVGGLVDGLEQMDEPVVLVLFGDHKPWGGNGNSAYTGAGVAFDMSTWEGFSDYYATPYLIWANDAAKQALGNQFIGQADDISPCFLMEEVFTQCGWEGPGFMQLARQMRAVTPLVHARGLYLQNGQLTDSLPPEGAEMLQKFLWAQYYRQQEARPSR
jgi:hypothetical protein